LNKETERNVTLAQTFGRTARAIAAGKFKRDVDLREDQRIIRKARELADLNASRARRGLPLE